MIQRVQSIWLFLASLTLFLLLILPILTKTGSTGELWLQVGGLYQKANQGTKQLAAYTPLFGFTIFTGLICLINIFNFKNRTLQKRIILLAIVFIIVIIAGAAYYAQTIPGGINGASFNAGTYLPIVSILFCVLAIRGISNDERLIRSADRLR